MGKSTIMGAGSSGIAHGVNVNGNQGGGTILQGLASTRNKPAGMIRHINKKANGVNRNIVFKMNNVSNNITKIITLTLRHTDSDNYQCKLQSNYSIEIKENTSYTLEYKHVPQQQTNRDTTNIEQSLTSSTSDNHSDNHSDNNHSSYICKMLMNVTEIINNNKPENTYSFICNFSDDTTDICTFSYSNHPHDLLNFQLKGPYTNTGPAASVTSAPQVLITPDMKPLISINEIIDSTIYSSNIFTVTFKNELTHHKVNEVYNYLCLNFTEIRVWDGTTYHSLFSIKEVDSTIIYTLTDAQHININNNDFSFYICTYEKEFIDLTDVSYVGVTFHTGVVDNQKYELFTGIERHFELDLYTKISNLKLGDLTQYNESYIQSSLLSNLLHYNDFYITNIKNNGYDMNNNKELVETWRDYRDGDHGNYYKIKIFIRAIEKKRMDISYLYRQFDHGMTDNKRTNQISVLDEFFTRRYNNFSHNGSINLVYKKSTFNSGFKFYRPNIKPLWLGIGSCGNYEDNSLLIETATILPQNNQPQNNQSQIVFKNFQDNESTDLENFQKNYRGVRRGYGFMINTENMKYTDVNSSEVITMKANTLYRSMTSGEGPKATFLKQNDYIHGINTTNGTHFKISLTDINSVNSEYLISSATPITTYVNLKYNGNSENVKFYSYSKA